VVDEHLLLQPVDERADETELDGGDERTLVTSKYANRLVPSPDEKWIAFTQLHKAFVAAMPAVGQTIDLDSKSTGFPVTQLSRDAGISLHWSRDSKKVFWTLGEEYFGNDLNKRFKFLAGAPDSLPVVAERTIPEGNAPAGMLQVYGGVPPSATRDPRYELPTWASDRDTVARPRAPVGLLGPEAEIVNVTGSELDSGEFCTLTATLPGAARCFLGTIA